MLDSSRGAATKATQRTLGDSASSAAIVSLGVGIGTSAVLAALGVAPTAVIYLAGACVLAIALGGTVASSVRVLRPLALAGSLRALLGGFVYSNLMARGYGASPVLPPIDAHVYYQSALALAQSRTTLSAVPLNAVGYPALLSLLFRWFGASVAIPIALNTLCGTLLVAVVARISYEATGDRKTSQRAAWLIALLPGLFSLDAWVAKDPLIFLCLAIGVLCVVASVKSRAGAWTAMAILALSIFGLSILRPLAAGVLVLFGAVAASRRLSPVRYALGYYAAVVIVVASIIAWMSGLVHFSGNALRQLAMWSPTRTWSNGGGQGFVTTLFKHFGDWPLWKRLATWPLAVALQVVLPFRFWNPGGTYVYAMIWNAANPIWLFVIGPLCLYGVLKARYGTPSLRLLALCGAALFAASAFLTAGTVPRYGLMAMVFLVPAAAFGLGRLLGQGRWRSEGVLYVGMVAVVWALGLGGYALVR